MYQLRQPYYLSCRMYMLVNKRYDEILDLTAVDQKKNIYACVLHNTPLSLPFARTVPV